jgi:undecaprenyl diphosphate synthase
MPVFESLPKHVAIIMDGNGRWAASQKLPRFRGHLEGVKRVEEAVETASRLGIKVLTLFTFSTENWNRPVDEVSMLMKTLCTVLQKKAQKLFSSNVRLNLIGRREGVPTEVLKTIESVIDLTKNNTGLIVNLAFNYGSRIEIMDAVKNIAKSVRDKKLNLEDINEEMFGQYLYTKNLPDPDLLVRTSGEKRISNFLLWQCSYTEFYFTNKYWPEFDEKEFTKALLEYQKRDRRFGQVNPAAAK